MVESGTSGSESDGTAKKTRGLTEPLLRISEFQDFPGGPVVETSPSSPSSAGRVPGQGAKVPRALQPKHQNIKQKQYGNKFNKDF